MKWVLWYQVLFLIQPVITMISLKHTHTHTYINIIWYMCMFIGECHLRIYSWICCILSKILIIDMLSNHFYVSGFVAMFPVCALSIHARIAKPSSYQISNMARIFAKGYFINVRGPQLVLRCPVCCKVGSFGQILRIVLSNLHLSAASALSLKDLSSLQGFI